LGTPHRLLVNDLNGEGLLIAWRAEWMSRGVPTGKWEWIFQIEGIQHADIHIVEWCEYPEPTL